MAIARIVETGVTPAQYDQLKDALGITDTPPTGGDFHMAVVGADGNIRVVKIWASRGPAKAWGEKVSAARSKAGLTGNPATIEYLEIHNIVQW